MFAAVGVALDKVILRRHDSAIKHWLADRWIALSEAGPSNLPGRAAGAYLRFVRRYIGSTSFSLRFVITSIAISLVMTTLFFFIGKGIRNIILRNVDPNFGSFWELLPGYIEMYQLHLNKAFVYPVNAAFDIATIVITTTLVARFLLSPRSLRGAGYIVLDITLCCALFYVCLFIIVSNDLATAPQGGLLSFHNHIYEQTRQPAMFAHWLSSGVAYSATVFYPTIIYLGVFLFLLIATAVIQLFRAVGLFYAESVVDNEKSVFFVTGTFLGVLAAMSKALAELFT